MGGLILPDTKTYYNVAVVECNSGLSMKKAISGAE